MERIHDPNGWGCIYKKTCGNVGRIVKFLEFGVEKHDTDKLIPI